MVSTHNRKGETRVLLEPTRLQLALALSIVRSKPNGYTVREYIQQLRQHISAQRTHPRKCRRQQLDVAAYWKTQCTFLEAEKQELRNRIVSLERENKLCVERAKNVEASASESESTRTTGTRSASKRSAAQVANDVPVRSAKKAKSRSSRAILQHETSPDAMSEDFGALDVGINGKIALESMWELQKLYGSSSPEPSALAYHLIRATTSITSILRSTSEKYRASLAESTSSRLNPLESSAASEVMREESFGAVFRAVAKAYSTNLFGIALFKVPEQDRTLRGSVLYSTVRMYGDILNLIHEDATQLREHMKRSSTQTPVTRSTSKHRKSTRDRNVSKALVNFLAAAISALETDSIAHQELFEGFMSVLLERLGESLYLFTFGRSGIETVEEGLLGNKNFAHQDEVKEVAEIEAPNLISLFERAMDMAPRFFNNPNLARRSMSTKLPSSSKLSSKDKISISKGRPILLLHAKTRLQHTLVKATFGPKDNNYEGFSEYLKTPEKVSAYIQPPVTEDKDIPSWYCEELWKLLGWDILAEGDDW